MIFCFLFGVTYQISAQDIYASKNTNFAPEYMTFFKKNIYIDTPDGLYKIKKVKQCCYDPSVPQFDIHNSNQEKFIRYWCERCQKSFKTFHRFYSHVLRHLKHKTRSTHCSNTGATTYTDDITTTEAIG